MNPKDFGKNSICTHAGNLNDSNYGGAVSPLYLATAYPFEGVEEKRYPRYGNTPNQQALAQKIAALEHAEAAFLFSSGMAAISSALFAFLAPGDHVVMQDAIYGGTRNLLTKEFNKFKIEYTYVQSSKAADFEAAIQDNTRVIYIETPSNPLLNLVDIKAIAKIAKANNLVSMIDNTFASPINQNPIDFGIDLSIHSATKYMSGHSDILAGAVAGSRAHIDQITETVKSFGGTLAGLDVYLLERSLKTMALRVKRQNRNAKRLAKWLEKQKDVAKVFYPGLRSHPDYKLAKKQMRGYGGMLSFELAEGLSVQQFLDSLKLIKPAMSLAGVESTLTRPHLTSHKALTEAEREAQGISKRLCRLSVGIEEVRDLKTDIENAINLTKRLETVVDKV